MISNPYSSTASHIDKLEANLFTSLPATVKSFNSEEQTITAQPVMLEPYTTGETLYFPELEDIPVMFVGAGGGSLTFPIKQGDEVLLMMSCRSFDTWWETGEIDQLNDTQRYHHISDAIAMIGLTSKPNSFKASTEDVELKFNDKNKLALRENGDVDIETASKFSVSNQGNELISVISDALQAMADITTNTVYGISPVNNKANILAIKSKLDTFKK